eukprot:COSAG01_NODE_721_length_14068_cov_479.648436_6_plen_160_part_00
MSAGSDHEQLGRISEILKDVSRSISQVQLHQNLETESQFLQNIISALRDQSSPRKILGLLVDRELLQKIFGASVGVLYLVGKETFDQMIRDYHPLYDEVLVEGQDDRGNTGPSDGDSAECLAAPEREVFRACVGLAGAVLANTSCNYVTSNATLASLFK